jgi:hypothetical protein
MELTFIVVGGLVLLGIISIAALLMVKRKELREPEDGMYPKGYFLNKGIAIGIPIGVPIGLALGNLAIGLPFGLAIGYAIGASWEEKNKDKIRPLTPEEEKRKKTLKMFTLALVLLGIILFAAVYLISGSL